MKHLATSNRQGTKVPLGCEVWCAKHQLDEICCSRESFVFMMRHSGFFFSFHLSIWASGNVHSVFGQFRAKLNAVSLLRSASYICFTVYFMASVREGTAERTVHSNGNCALTASLCGKGFMKGPELESQIACFKSKFQMCAQDGHL